MIPYNLLFNYILCITKNRDQSKLASYIHLLQENDPLLNQN